MLLIRREQQFETSCLCCGDELAVSQSIPSTFYGFNHYMAREGMSKRGGSAVIEENEHRVRVREGKREESPSFALQIRSRQLPAGATGGTSP